MEKENKGAGLVRVPSPKHQMTMNPITQIVYCLINNKGRYYQNTTEDNTGKITWWGEIPTEARLFASKRIAEMERNDKGIKADIYQITLKPEIIQ